jgi:hypothetical protein
MQQIKHEVIGTVSKPENIYLDNELEAIIIGIIRARRGKISVMSKFRIDTIIFDTILSVFTASYPK